MVDERLPDRLPPAAREQFFEQLAFLKLTIADAEEAAMAAETQPETPAKPAVPMDVERLRDVALSAGHGRAGAAGAAGRPPLTRNSTICPGPAM